MDWWFWLAWTFFLCIQNASFTMVSRARNSGSVAYHAVAAVGSNGIWFVSQLFLLTAVFQTLLTDFKPWQLVFVGVYYTAITVLSSISMHAILLRFEKGKGSRRN